MAGALHLEARREMHEVRFQQGEVIFTEGEPGDHCYKIVSGKVGISIDVRGVMRRRQRKTVASCGPGEFFGEMSLIAGGPRSASAMATEPTVCTAYSADEIMAALQNDPKEALAYVHMLIHRLRESNRRMSRPDAGRG